MHIAHDSTVDTVNKMQHTDNIRDCSQ